MKTYLTFQQTSYAPAVQHIITRPSIGKENKLKSEQRKVLQTAMRGEAA